MGHKHLKRGRHPSGEHWTKLLRQTLEEPAWRALSSTAQALYPWLKLEWRGPDANNNGKIRLSVRQAADRMGVIPDTAAKGFRDLQRKGFIVQTEAAYLGIEGAAKAPAYEITELKLPGAAGDGRKLYRQWSPGHDFTVQTTGANNPRGCNGRNLRTCHENHDDAVMKTMTKSTDPVMKTMTGRHENHDEKVEMPTQTVMKTMTSLSYHTSAAESAPSREPAGIGGEATRARTRPARRLQVKDLVRGVALDLSVPVDTEARHGR